MKAVRLFFALWPDEATRAALHGAGTRLVAECGGRATLRGNLHLTLAFLGEVDPVRLPRLGEIGVASPVSPAELVVDRAGLWRHNRVLWIGCKAPPPGLVADAARLATALLAEGFQLETRPFEPHVTVARRASRLPASGVIDPICWPCRGMALVESVASRGGRVYRVLRRFDPGTGNP